MLPVKKKSRIRNITCKPFPECMLTGYFTGYNVEIFDYNQILELDCSDLQQRYGTNSKPRQMLSINCDRSKKLSDPQASERKDLQSIVLFLEEAFFLHNEIKCLEIRDIFNNTISTEELWNKFCSIKKSFIESYVSYVYLKSKNWVIKPGTKFGGNFCKFFTISQSSVSNKEYFSTLQADSYLVPRFIHRYYIQRE